MCGDEVTAIDFVSGTSLESSGVETVGLTLAVRVLGSTTILHLAITLELGVADLQAVVDIPLRESDDVLQPSCTLHGIDVVVVTEGVTLANVAARIEKVVLEHVGVVGEVALAVLVDIKPVFTTQQVADGLIIMCACVVD